MPVLRVKWRRIELTGSLCRPRGCWVRGEVGLARPYFHYSGEQLAARFDEHHDDPDELKRRRAELKHRTRPKMVELLGKVELRISDLREMAAVGDDARPRERAAEPERPRSTPDAAPCQASTSANEDDAEEA